MKVIDNIKHKLHPEIRSDFRRLLSLYYKGFWEFCKRNQIGKNNCFTYSEMKKVVQNKSSIIKRDFELREWEKQNQKRSQLKYLAEKYPHAYLYFCKKYLGDQIKIDSIKFTTPVLMPGKRRSKLSQKRSSSYFIQKVNIIDWYNIFSLENYIHTPISKSQSHTTHKPKPSPPPLPPDPTEKLNAVQVALILYFNPEFPKEEDRILSELRQEDIDIKFDDEVLDNVNRKFYYKAFLKKNNREDNDKEYLIERFEELDKFMAEAIHEDYLNLEKKYPVGLNHYKKINKDHDEASIARSRDIIILYNTYLRKAEEYKEWEKEQSDFTLYTRNAFDEDWGNYRYDITFPMISEIGMETKGQYTVWQHFYSSIYLEGGLDFHGYFQYIIDNTNKNNEFLIKERYYRNTVHEKCLDCVLEIKKKYGEVSVIWGTSNVENYRDFNNYHFKYLKDKLDENHIESFYLEDLNPERIGRFIVCIELITKNESLRELCSKIVKVAKDKRPLITYFSYRKNYDREEMLTLIRREEKKKQEIIRRHQEEERKRQEERLRHQETHDLKACVSSWTTSSRSSVRCFSLYYYYPTTCDWEASQSVWNIRYMIWNFKANPHNNKSESQIIHSHREAVDEIIPDLQFVLDYYFGNLQTKLTLVCIPSSKRIVTERRYKDFSERLCSATGMTNGYAHVHVLEEGEAKHLGGTQSAQFSVDSSFFNDKRVILFDDVITTGRSMEKFKRLLESAGATIIGGLSIGKTKHERQPNNPIDSL